MIDGFGFAWGLILAWILWDRAGIYWGGRIGLFEKCLKGWIGVGVGV